MDNKWWWIIGGAIALYIIYRVMRNFAVAQTAAKAEAAPATVSPTPIFVSSGGGLGGLTDYAGSPPMSPGNGGAAWVPPTVPLAENPDVKIAEINAGVINAQTAAQKAIAAEMIKLAQAEAAAKNPVVTPSPSGGSGSGSGTAVKRATLDDTVAYIQQFVIPDPAKNIPGVRFTSAGMYDMYQKAREYNVPVSQVATALNIALNKTDVTPDLIRRQIAGLGLAPLPD